MTHPPYGDDEREQGQSPTGQPPTPEPPFGPPRYGPPGPYAQPGRYPPPSYGGASDQQYGAPGQPPYGRPAYGPPPPYGPPGPYGQPPAPGYGAPGRQHGSFGAPGPYGLPPYGPVAWDQEPPRRSRRGTVLVLGLLVLVAVVLLATALPGLLSSTALDPQAVQRDVAQQFQQREGVPLDLRCDDRMTVETGRSYECQGTTADGEPITITITIAGEDASYTWSEG